MVNGGIEARKRQNKVGQRTPLKEVEGTNRKPNFFYNADFIIDVFVDENQISSSICAPLVRSRGKEQEISCNCTPLPKLVQTWSMPERNLYKRVDGELQEHQEISMELYWLGRPNPRIEIDSLMALQGTTEGASILSKCSNRDKK